MIFATVGAQMPFDRLIRALDEWARQHDRRDVFAQIGSGAYRPSGFEWRTFLPPPEFRSYVSSADLIVAHAGTGSIMTALELGKPILVMPRREALGETRNDHQMATAERFLAQGRVAVAFDEHELPNRLDDLMARPERWKAVQQMSSYASDSLIRAIRQFIFEDLTSSHTKRKRT